MTREEAKAAAEVMLAYANGQEIELRRTMPSASEWEHHKAPCFDWNLFEYRVKPKPREWWIQIDECDRVVGQEHSLDINRRVKVREVLE